jgi:hypothetical protein
VIAADFFKPEEEPEEPTVEGTTENSEVDTDK